MLGWPTWPMAKAGSLVLAALVSLGCDGTRRPVDTSIVDAPVATIDSGEQDAGAPDTRPAPSGQPLPANVRAPVRLLDGQAELVGDVLSTCTSDRRAGSGDRWCAFSQPGASGGSELWVVNVTQAAAGAVPTCDGSHAGCVRLTAKLWTDGALFGPRHPYAHRFHGDTLIFYADALSGLHQVHKGPSYAWRPGWTQARRISSDRGLECWGHTTALLAFCVEDPTGDPENPDDVEVRVGPIDDRDGIELISLGRWRLRNSEGIPTWQAGFSPDGGHFAFSSPGPDPTLETLEVVATAALGQAPPSAIVAGASSWRISHDGRRVYFLRDEGLARPGLYVADFPSGANSVRLESGVETVSVLGGEGVDLGLAVTSATDTGAGAFRLFPDPRDPTGWTTVLSHQDNLMAFQVSPDARFTAWTDNRFVARVVRHSDLSTCMLNRNPRRPVHSPVFLRRAGLVFWAEDSGGELERRDGYFADPISCAGQRFAQAVYFIAPVDDRGLVFADETDDGSQRATLKYVALADGKSWPEDGPVRIQDDIDGTSVVPAGWDPLLLLFRVSGGDPARRGTYLFGPVPF